MTSSIDARSNGGAAAAASKIPMLDMSSATVAHHADVIELRLLGQPCLGDHLTFVQERVVGGAETTPADTADSWRAANDVYEELETSEAGFADAIETREINGRLAALVEQTKRSPRYLYTFDTFPTTIAMVELDRLVVCQDFIRLAHSEGLQRRLGEHPSPEALFRFCQPENVGGAPVEVRQAGNKRYVFISESTDFRRHEAVLLRPDQVIGHKTFGPLSGFVAVPVGFGSNYFMGIRYRNRILLHNGYHRAHAMRALGIRFAPCIIQSVTRHDEIAVAAKSKVVEDPAFYFSDRRPPVLKDFFDPRICKTFTVYRTAKVIEVTFEVCDFFIRT